MNQPVAFADRALAGQAIPARPPDLIRGVMRPRVGVKDMDGHEHW
jgi:hypothetical protein